MPYNKQKEKLLKTKYRKVISYVLAGDSVAAAMRKVGYSHSTSLSGSSKILKSPLFQECLAEIPDDWLLAKTLEIARKKDARASLAALQMLFKLKDRFPANKLKVQEFQDELNDLKADEDK